MNDKLVLTTLLNLLIFKYLKIYEIIDEKLKIKEEIEKQEDLKQRKRITKYIYNGIEQYVVDLTLPLEEEIIDKISNLNKKNMELNRQIKEREDLLPYIKSLFLVLNISKNEQTEYLKAVEMKNIKSVDLKRFLFELVNYYYELKTCDTKNKINNNLISDKKDMIKLCIKALSKSIELTPDEKKKIERIIDEKLEKDKIYSL